MKKKKIILAVPKNINEIILLVVLFFSSTILYSQVAPNLNVTLKLKIKEGDLKNSQISITKKGAPYKVIDPSKGGYAVDLNLGYEFEFTYSKLGYITKIVLVDTHVPEHRENGVFEKLVCEVELEKQPQEHSINHSLPSAKIAYSNSKGDFSFEKEYDPKAEKTREKEKNAVSQKAKITPGTNSQNNAIPVIIKQSENKTESPSYKPAVKNREEKVIQEDNKKITIITINNGVKDYIYRKEEYGWGTYFYKDNKGITENTFTNETK